MLRAFLACVLPALFLSGCTYQTAKTGALQSTANPLNLTPPLPGAGTSGSFQHVLNDILMPKCGDCHAGANPDGDLLLDSYEVIMKGQTVVPGAPFQSKMYSSTATGAMPQEAPPLSDDELADIYHWIQNGAQND